MEENLEDMQSTDPLELEHHIQRIITKQEQTGFLFNSSRARFYIHVLRERQVELYLKIRPLLSLEVDKPYTVPVNKPFLASGGKSAAVYSWYPLQEDVDKVSGPFSRVEFREPDLGKRLKLVNQLLKLGWKPLSFTEKGSPQLKVDSEPCPSLLKIDSDIGRWIGEWYTYRHRESQIAGWLKAVRPDGRISAGAITIGTPTFRFRHTVVVNIPKATKRVLFGSRMRSLFTVDWRRGYRLVGHDASGLELRMLAHYINDDSYTQEVTHGDPHKRNQTDAGLPSRDDAKTFIYAFIYGAGNAKIGSIVGGSARKGGLIKKRFLSNNPKLDALISSSQRGAKKGWFSSLDGRKVLLRRDKFTGEVQTHKALNTKLQTAGAVVMKWSMHLLDKWVTEMGLDVRKVVDMHDEGQAEVHLKDINMYKYLARQSIIEAGKLLKLNCPLDAEAKVGLNWAQTH